MAYMGANIYYWGAGEQRTLLLNGVRRWALEARSRALADRFLYCRFDARGPHVTALFTGAAEAQASLREFLDVQIRSFLLEFPSSAAVAPEEIERRHLECRGKSLCVADREDGLAPNNSFVLFQHTPRDYPFWLGSGMASADEFWQRLDRLTFWTLEQLEGPGLQAKAIRWLAAVDRSLQRGGLPAESYWRLHATTLLPSLRERLKTEEEEVKSSLRRAVGDRNCEVFSKIWNELSSGGDHEFDVDGIVDLIAADRDRTLEQRLSLLREVNHLVLGQLSQTVNFQIPMVLYAWHCSLTR
jgi:hypothetical protein